MARHGVAGGYRVPVKVVANAAMRVPAEPLIELVVREGFGAVDDWIAEVVTAADVVVTSDIPLAARIAHVADAYDAITSARAYRAARSSAEAMRELWRCAGTEFHADIVAALATALPGVTFDRIPEVETVGA